VQPEKTPNNRFFTLRLLELDGMIELRSTVQVLVLVPVPYLPVQVPYRVNLALY
jgi:hypothetical protein